MVKKMNNYKPAVYTFLIILAVHGLLFGYVSHSFAQEEQGWTQPVNLSLSGIATNPLLAIDSDNMLHTIWVDAVDGYKYSQSVDGAIWTKPQTVKFPFDKKSALPVLLSDASGAIHVFWIDKSANLFYAKTTPADISIPSRWQSTRLAPNIVNYDVVLDDQDVLHVAYINNLNTEATPSGIYYRQSFIGGGSWNGDVSLYESEYFRTATGTESSVRIATSNTSTVQRVYVTWDERPQKRVFLAISNDSGLNWSEAQPIKGIEDTGGIDAPFNLNVAAANDKVLIFWQEGEPGTAMCAVFSQWSEDNGESWGDVVSVLGGRTNCPVSSKFIVQNEDYLVALLIGQGDPTLAAWNGNQWSNPQTQTQLPTFSNPLTLDAILLGCRFDLVHRNRLYTVGCDQGGGGDVWFLSRPLAAVENWFALPKTWGAPAVISGKSETISSLSSAPDANGEIHSVWVQSSLSENGSQKFALEYARWDGKQWTRPESIVSSLDSAPLQMTFTLDTKERLLLSWIDGDSGDLLISWANLEGANLASNWTKPVGLPSPSKLIGFPDIVVDGSGRIVIVYSIPLNEGRGIYAVQSIDSGKSWSPPMRIFDAVSVRWEKISEPKLSLSKDGVLHLIFSRNFVRAGQPVGLYYSKSVDGGITWNNTQIISEGDIQWSDIVSYDDRTVHVLWQEHDGLVFANLSQVSQDGGESWGKTLDITGVNDSISPVALAIGGSENLHFIQLLKDHNAATINQDNLILQDWEWTGSGWEIASSSKLVIKGKGINYSLTADITSKGSLVVSMTAEYLDPENTIQNEILTFHRYIDNGTGSTEPMVALIPTPVGQSDATETPNTVPTQPVDLSVLNDDNVATTPLQRNLVGILIIAGATVVTAVLLIRRHK
jgi:hypothetical protein